MIFDHKVIPHFENVAHDFVQLECQLLWTLVVYFFEKI